MLQDNEGKTHFSTTEVAEIMHISSVAVLKKIKTGKLVARKVGRNYIVARADLEDALGSIVTPEQKEDIEKIVKKAVKEYGDTFRRLGKEE